MEREFHVFFRKESGEGTGGCTEMHPFYNQDSRDYLLNQQKLTFKKLSYFFASRTWLVLRLFAQEPLNANKGNPRL